VTYLSAATLVAIGFFVGAFGTLIGAGGGFLLEATGTATIFTPEMLSEEQQLMRETADDFVKREVEPRLAEPGTEVTVRLPSGRLIAATVMPHHAHVDPDGGRMRV